MKRRSNLFGDEYDPAVEHFYVKSRESEDASEDSLRGYSTEALGGTEVPAEELPGYETESNTHKKEDRSEVLPFRDDISVRLSRHVAGTGLEQGSKQAPIEPLSRDRYRYYLYHGSVDEIRSALNSTQSRLVNLPIAFHDQNLPLHVAASRGRRYARTILRAGAEVDSTNNAIGTALQWAAAKGSLSTVKLLIDHGACVNAKAGWKGTALIAAVRSKSKATVSTLLDHGADLKQLDLYGYSSPLSAAADIEMMELLLNHGADPQQQTRDTHVLVKAVQGNDRPAVKLLLRYGADASMCVAKRSVLDLAVGLDNLEIAMDLLGHGAKVYGQVAGCLLLLAVERGDGSLLQALLHHGVDPNSYDSKHDYPLITASSIGRLDLMGILLNFGADINRRNATHESPLLSALQGGHMEAAELLFRGGANVPNALYWSSVPEVAPRLALWKSLALNSTYDSIGQLLADYDNAGGNIPIASLEFPWQIPLLLGQQQQPQAAPSSALHNHVVLTRWYTNDKNGDEVMRTEALTCLEYVQRRWSNLGLQVLNDLGCLALRNNQSAFPRSYKLDDQSEIICSYQVNTKKTILRVSINNTKSGDNLFVVSFISLLDWIFRALRTPSSEDISVSSSSCQISSSYEQSNDSPDAHSSSSPTVLSGIQLTFQHSTKPLIKTGHDCWHELFKSAFVVETDGPGNSEKAFGKGLEMSFGLMAALAGVEYPVIVNDGVVLVGYQTLLVPTLTTTEYTQFHLEVNRTGQMNPFTASYGSRTLTADYLPFTSMPCYVGWCEFAHIMLGTQFSSAYDVKYSGCPERRQGLQLSGVSTGFQLNSAGPIHAGVIGQANFSMATNRVSFTPTTVYSKMLRDTAQDVAMIYDARSRQSWVVPKISVLLHMAHAWIKENTSAEDFESPKFSDSIPFVNPHSNGFEVVAALDNAGDVIVCGSGEDALRLRTLLLGLNINMLKTSAAANPIDGRALYGFEFMDIVTEPGRGCMMKKIYGWSAGRVSNGFKIANSVDLVIICADLGSAIKPVKSPERHNDLCNTLPIGLGLLAMHVSCMIQLTKRHGGDLTSTMYSNEVVVSEGRSWKLSGEIFKACEHEASSLDTCWNRSTILQEVCATNGSPTSKPRRIALSGAVVFGTRHKRMGFL